MSKQTKANEALWEAGLRIVQDQLRRNMVKVDMATFNNNCSEEHTTCDTARCIGGWFSTIVLQKPQGGNPLEIANWPTSRKFEKRLNALFYPDFEYDDEFSSYEYEKLTNKQAVKAIDNFLAGKANPWYGIVSKQEQLKGREFE